MTVTELTGLLGDDVGVRRQVGLFGSRAATPAPPGLAAAPGYRPATPDELPAGFASGFWLESLVVDVTTYLPYLLDRFKTAGGTLQQHTVQSFDELIRRSPVIVNCSGVGAAQLAGDDSVSPDWGMHTIIRNPGVSTHFMEGPPGAPTWLSWMPHGDRILIGGVSRRDRRTPDPDLELGAELLAAAAEANPMLAGAVVVGYNAGVRPARPSIRLEVEQRDDIRIVHTYGHGGLGLTLSWGCAREACMLAQY